MVGEIWQGFTADCTTDHNIRHTVSIWQDTFPGIGNERHSARAMNHVDVIESFPHLPLASDDRFKCEQRIEAVLAED